MITRKLRYAVARGGLRYAIDDRGDTVWLSGTHRGSQAEFSTREEAQRVIDTYAASTRRSMRVVEVRA